MKSYGRRRNYRKKTTKKSNYKKRGGVSLATKRFVKRAIHSNVENKKTQFLSSNNAISSYLQNNSLFTQSMIPYAQINQGVGQSDRIADKIKTMKCHFKYALTPAPYSAQSNATPQPHEVVLMFGKVKNSRPQLPVQSDFARLFQNNNGSRAPLGTLADLVSITNSDWFTIYKIVRHKIGSSSYSTAGMSPTWQYYANNDFKLNVVRTLNLTKHCPKNVIFNDTTQQPTNDGLWMWAFCVPSDGSTYAPVAPILLTYELVYEYEDA